MEENSDIITLIMAAGKGTRMKSNKSKLIQKIYGKEIVSRVVRLAEEIGSSEIIAVVGYLREEIENVLGSRVKYAYQEELLGTGHAVMQAEKYLKGKKGKVVILYGDVPIIRPETLKNLIAKSNSQKEYATVLTAIYENPKGYGRIVRDEGGSIKEIVEEKDAGPLTKEIKEINSGIYCFDIEELLLAIKQLKPNNVQGEYYLTDVIKIMNEKGLKTGAVIVEDDTEILGVNDRVQLELLTKVLRKRINNFHMKNGVTIEDSDTAYIYDDVIIGKDTVISPNVTIKSNTVIGQNCEIGSNTYIEENVKIDDNIIIENGIKIKAGTIVSKDIID